MVLYIYILYTYIYNIDRNDIQALVYKKGGVFFSLIITFLWFVLLKHHMPLLPELQKKHKSHAPA